MANYDTYTKTKYKANTLDTTASEQLVNETQAALAAIGEYSYNDANGYLQSRNNALDEYTAMQSAGYQSQYTSDLNELYDNIMNYADFSYDTEKDTLYQQYKQQYQLQGKQAMQNQLAAAAANTGGYNSSYAQTSAQQAYQSSMDELGDKAMDLYANAYSQYQNEYEELNNRYSLVNQADQQAENSWYNQLDALKGTYDMYSSAYSDDYTNQYNNYSDSLNTAQTNYNNAVAQNQWLKSYNQTETNNANTLNQSETQFKKTYDETSRHNYQTEKTATNAAAGKTTTKKKSS